MLGSSRGRFVETMKVAMLTTVGSNCGIAAYTRALVEGLRTLPETEIEVMPISPGKQDRSHYIEQAEKINAADIDLVHIQHEHSFWGGIMPRSSSFWELRYLIKKPVVLTAHTTYSLEHMLRVKTERRPHKLLVKRLLLMNSAYRQSVDTAPFVTAITIVHTAAARNELIERGVNPAYVIVVPTGVPVADAAPSQGEQFRAKFGLAGSRTLTMFGYIAPNKGYELAIGMLSRLPKDVKLVIAGGARNAGMEAYVATLQRTIEQSGLADRIIVTGFLSDIEVAEAMAASDLVLTPHTEATGSYSVMLPITHGRPILASNMDCFKEIRDRVGCLEIFEAGNSEALLSKTLELLADDARRDKLANMALTYATKYSWPRVAASTRTVYEAAIRVYREGSHHSHM